MNSASRAGSKAATDPEKSPEDLNFQYVKELTQTFEELTQRFASSTEEVVFEAFQELNQVFGDFFENFAEITEEIEDMEETKASIFDILIEFFKTDHWPFQTLPTQSALRLAFQGKNGTWDCYAKAREEQQQVVFYSISPITTAPTHRPTIAEFLTRANYGLILGNFELDYTDGEIRYKTSIDIEGDRLTPTLIQNLVYTNVMTMDQYLPGILAVLEQNATPQQAIHLVEDGTPIPVDSKPDSNANETETTPT